MTSVLFVLSAADHWTLRDGTRHPTGVWAEEFVAPHRRFTAAGWQITLASPNGTTPTIDAVSLSPEGAGSQEAADDLTAALAGIDLVHTLRLDEVKAADFDVVFYPGGHGPMEDLAVDADSGRILSDALAAGIPLAVLCHAPAALFAALSPDGTWPFTGYRMTGFSDEEETINQLADKAPWLLETRLVENGVVYSKADAPFGPHMVVDRSLITGQNPASSAPVADALVSLFG